MKTQIQSIIGSRRCGKTTICDYLLAQAGIIPLINCGIKKPVDSSEQQDSAQGLKTSHCSLIIQTDLNTYESPQQTTEKILMNMMDCPGEVELSYEECCALHVSDGSLLCCEIGQGVSMKTYMSLSQTLSEAVPAGLVVTKIDLYLQKQSEQLTAQALSDLIDELNQTVKEKIDSISKEQYRFYPERGNVIFASPQEGWGFRIPQIVDAYAKQFKLSTEAAIILSGRLWGKHWYDPERGWITDEDLAREKCLPTGFEQYVLRPIYELYRKAEKLDVEGLSNFLESMGVAHFKAPQDANPLKLRIAALRAWLPIERAVSQLAVKHLPSPLAAQRNRVDLLYSGPLDSTLAESIRTCDARNSLFVSR